MGQDKEGSLTENSHIRHARDGIIQTVQVVDIPDDYEKQVAEKRKLLEDYLSGAGSKKHTHTQNKDQFVPYDIHFFFHDSYGPLKWIQHHKFLVFFVTCTLGIAPSIPTFKNPFSERNLVERGRSQDLSLRLSKAIC